MTTDTPTTNKPLKAYKTREYQIGKEIKTQYHEVGIAWPHKKGNGFNLEIHEGISVTGKITVLEQRERQAGEDEEIPFGN